MSIVEGWLKWRFQKISCHSSDIILDQFHSKFHEEKESQGVL